MTTELIDSKDYAPDTAIEKIVKSLDEETQKWLDQPIAHLSEPAPIENAIKGRIEELHSLTLSSKCSFGLLVQMFQLLQLCQNQLMDFQRMLL